MNLPKKTVHPYPKKENFHILPEDTVTFFKNERDRLFAAEKKSRTVEEMIGQQMPGDVVGLTGDNPPAFLHRKPAKPADKRPE
jgi:hypothetical protein